MGTRGLYGFRRYGFDKTTYNHFDSYPEYLGKLVGEFCANTSIDDMRKIYDRIQLVNEGSQPNAQQVDFC
jgi:glycine betaine/choline ABC-type transport system substrate-binding protein